MLNTTYTAYLSDQDITNMLNMHMSVEMNRSVSVTQFVPEQGNGFKLQLVDNLDISFPTQDDNDHYNHLYGYDENRFKGEV